MKFHRIIVEHMLSQMATTIYAQIVPPPTLGMRGEERITAAQPHQLLPVSVHFTHSIFATQWVDIL